MKMNKEDTIKKINKAIDLFWINNYDELKHDINLMFTSLKVKLEESLK